VKSERTKLPIAVPTRKRFDVQRFATTEGVWPKEAVKACALGGK
jgi:hypothetical protein